MRGRTKNREPPPLCPSLPQWARLIGPAPQLEVEASALVISILFAKCAALSDCYCSRPCRLLRRRGSRSGGRPSHFSKGWDARHCQQPLSRDHAGDGRSAVRGPLARHMTCRLQLGRDLPQCAAAAVDGIAGQPLGKRDGFRLRLGDTTPAAALARLELLALAGLAQLGDKGLLLELGDERPGLGE
jgi:hypothetical protein